MTATATRPAPPPSAATPSPVVRANAFDDTIGATLSLTLLTLVSVVCLGRLFADGSFLAPVIVTAVACHGLAWVLRVRGVPTPIAHAAALIATLLLASWTVLPHTTVFGFPGPGTLHAAQHELQRAGEEFRRVVAPAPTIPGFRLAAVLGAAMCAFLADWAAFRMRALFEAVLPSFTIFLFSAILGGERWNGLAVAGYIAAILIFLVIQNARLQGTSMAWFASRSRGGLPSLLRVAAVIGCVVVVAALVLGPRLPGSDSPPLLHWRNSERPGPGNRTTVSPLVDIRGRLVDRSTIEVFTVRSNIRAYWRLTSLDQFDGDIWSSNSSYRPSKGNLPEEYPSNVPTQRATQQYVIGPLASIWLPVAFEPVRVDGADGASYNADSASLISAEDTADGLNYRVVSQIPRPTAASLRGTTGTRLSIADAARYTTLPAGVPPRILNLARQIASRAPDQSVYARALGLQQFFRSPPFVYDLTVPPGHNDQALERFLFERHRGYCEQYAGAYAVLARAMGIPARVAVGYTPGETGADGAFHVRGLNAHAWPEVYIVGAGWVPFEPTPGRGVPGGESYTGQPEQQANAGNPATATTVAPTTTEPTTPQNDNSPATTAPRRDINAGNQGRKSPLPAPVMALLILIVVGAVLWGALVPVAKRLRRDRRRTSAALPADRVLVAWDEASEALALAGARRQLAETLPEYAGRAARATALDGLSAGLLEELADDASAASYSNDEVPPDVAARAVEAAARIEAELQEGAGRGKRLRWALDPRPLRTRR
jgi:transglutaminase-like putative cysteine protease